MQNGDYNNFFRELSGGLKEFNIMLGFGLLNPF